MLFGMTRKRLVAVAIFAAASSPGLQAQTSGLSLNEALRKAGAQSPAIEASQAEVEVARGEERQAGIGPNPEVSVEAENIAGTGIFKGLRATEYTVSVGQRLELGGKRGARKRAAAALTNIAEIEAEMARVQLAADVRTAFTGALAAKKRLMFARRVVQRNRELSRIAGILVEVGRDPPLRALRANAALGEAEAALQGAIGEDYSARLTLAALWGSSVPPENVEDFWLNENSIEADADPAKSLPIILADARSAAAKAVTRRERANSVPDVTLSGGFRRFAESRDNAFVVGASIGIPLRNRNQGNIAAARAAIRSAEAQRALTLLSVNRDYNIARSQLLASQARVQSLQDETLPQAEEALRLARLGYRYGKFTLIDVLDAATARDAAEMNLLSAKVARAEAVTTLLRLSAR